jgi:hypothetical protein
MTAAEVLGYDIPPDKPDAPCAACGAATVGGGVRRPCGDDRGRSSLLMLCSNAAACASRYRAGLTAEQFASNLKTETVLHGLIDPAIRWKDNRGKPGWIG